MYKMFSFFKFVFILIVSLCLVACGDTQTGNDSDPSDDQVEDSENNKQEIYAIYVCENENVQTFVKESGVPGEEIAIDIKLKDGYYLQSIKINDTFINSTTFTMPKCDVLIEVNVVTENEAHSVATLESEYGLLFSITERAKNGEVVSVRVLPNEGFRLSKLYANNVEIPFLKDDYGYYSNVVMQNQDLVFKAEFKEVEKLSDDFTFSLTSNNPNNPACSHWKATYLSNGIVFNVLVEDETIVNTASLATYNNDNIEFLICKATNLRVMDDADVYKCIVNVEGRYLFQKAIGTDLEFEPSSKNIGLKYGENFTADSIICTEEINGFDGYAVEVFIGYDLLNLTNDEAIGNLTFAPSLKDSVSYDYDTSKLETYWNSTDYTYNREHGDQFFTDDLYKCQWGNPSTFLGVTNKNQIVSRFMDVYKDVDYMFLGDSYLNPKFWGTYKEDTKDIFALNFGFSGSHSTDWIKTNWLNTVVKLSPKNIVIHLGVNDFNIGLKSYDCASRVTKLSERLQNLFTKLHEIAPNSRLYWITMEPNKLHESEFIYYEQVNNAIMEYAKNIDYLTVIDTSEVLLENSNILSSFYLNDNLHMSSFGYTRWVNVIRDGLNLKPLYTHDVFGNAKTGWASSGWQISDDGVLKQTGSESTFSDRYIFFKDYYASRLKVTASFNVTKINNGDSAPKFGFVLDDGTEQIYVYIGTNNKLKDKTVGYVTRTGASNGKGASINWSSGEETSINCYFTETDWANLEVIKDGASLKIVINGFEIYDVILTKCINEVSVGFFTFNTELNIKNAMVEVM